MLVLAVGVVELEEPATARGTVRYESCESVEEGVEMDEAGEMPGRWISAWRKVPAAASESFEDSTPRMAEVESVASSSSQSSGSSSPSSVMSTPRRGSGKAANRIRGVEGVERGADEATGDCHGFEDERLVEELASDEPERRGMWVEGG